MLPEWILVPTILGVFALTGHGGAQERPILLGYAKTGIEIITSCKCTPDGMRLCIAGRWEEIEMMPDLRGASSFSSARPKIQLYAASPTRRLLQRLGSLCSALMIPWHAIYSDPYPSIGNNSELRTPLPSIAVARRLLSWLHTCSRIAIIVLH